MFDGGFSGGIKALGSIMMIVAVSGCSTTIDKDTKLSLKGPKAELSRKF